MQIHLSGHHLDLTDGIRDAVDGKFAKIASHYPEITSLSAALTVERQSQKIEVTTLYRGAKVAVHAAHSDLYTAIAEAARKLDAALAKRKGATTAHRHAKPELEQIEASDEDLNASAAG